MRCNLGAEEVKQPELPHAEDVRLWDFYCALQPAGAKGVAALERGEACARSSRQRWSGGKLCAWRTKTCWRGHYSWKRVRRGRRSSAMSCENVAFRERRVSRRLVARLVQSSPSGILRKRHVLIAEFLSRTDAATATARSCHLHGCTQHTVASALTQLCRWRLQSPITAICSLAESFQQLQLCGRCRRR